MTAKGALPRGRKILRLRPSTQGSTNTSPHKAASKHITFGFWHGASIDDPSGRLETSGEVMAHAKLRTESDIDPTLFATGSSKRKRSNSASNGTQAQIPSLLTAL